MNLVFLGLSITSAWGNGHATTYRGLIRALGERGHRVLFLERDQPWYARNRDNFRPDGCEVAIYRSPESLAGFADRVADADAVIVGSYVPDGIAVADWVFRTAGGVTAFYDIDTPVTLAALARGECAYLDARQVPCFDLYLSFTGGPTLEALQRDFGAARAAALYCSADPAAYSPARAWQTWDLGYLGTYSPDRQPTLTQLLLEPARRETDRRFVVAGAQYPADLSWPGNVARVEHLPPAAHRAFYNAQRYTLNVTRQDMIRLGWSPSVRLFEAAACGIPVITDAWPGLGDFFQPWQEIFTASRPDEVQAILRDVPEGERRAVGRRARERFLAGHTCFHRALELEHLLFTISGRRPEPALASAH